jgi:hypothetical protein
MYLMRFRRERDYWQVGSLVSLDQMRGALDNLKLLVGLGNKLSDSLAGHRPLRRLSPEKNPIVCHGFFPCGTLCANSQGWHARSLRWLVKCNHAFVSADLWLNSSSGNLKKHKGDAGVISVRVVAANFRGG